MAHMAASKTQCACLTKQIMTLIYKHKANLSVIQFKRCLYSSSQSTVGFYLIYQQNKLAPNLFNVNVGRYNLSLSAIFQYLPLSKETEIQIYCTTNHTVISYCVVALTTRSKPLPTIAVQKITYQIWLPEPVLTMDDL